MITIITILMLFVGIFALPYIIKGSELIVDANWTTFLIGASFSKRYDEEDDATDYYVQLAIPFIVFTFSWSNES